MIPAAVCEPALQAVRLEGEVDLHGFRRAARALLAQGVAPERVAWRVGDAADGLFDADADANASSQGEAGAEAAALAMPIAHEGIDERVASAPERDPRTVTAPAFFAELCRSVVLHADADRFFLLYRMLWRLKHDARVRHDPLDADRLRLEQLARQAKRDLHKMKAFVRFRPECDEHEVVQVAWFEPAHHIVEAVAPFFMRRFTQMRWAILTPRRCVRWDGKRLQFGPGVRREDAPPADAGEQLWLTYYKHIFNPARLKLAMMCREMPRRYWPNLPEGALIAPLAAQAVERTGRMIEAEAPGAPPRRPPRPTVRVTAAAPPADAMAALRVELQQCRACPIGQHATQAVCGAGPLRARLMLVGEQPGDHEDLRGQPFVGPAGRLLDRAFAVLGWARETLYLTNAVKHFKYELRGKRRMHKTAAQREAQACLQWLEREIDIVQPAAIVALGATAARALLGRSVPVLQARGQWFEHADGQKVLVTIHPSALLRAAPAEQAAGFARWLQDLALAAPASSAD